MADDLLYIISTITEIRIAYFSHMIRRNNIHRLIYGKVYWKGNNSRKGENGVDDK